MARSFALTKSFAIVSLLISQISATCFFPDGSSDSSHSPCTSDSTSFCCDEGFQCLSNGLCNDARYDNFQRVLRGGCTDKSWGPGCPSRCTSGEFYPTSSYGEEKKTDQMQCGPRVTKRYMFVAAARPVVGEPTSAVVRAAWKSSTLG